MNIVSVRQTFVEKNETNIIAFHKNFIMNPIKPKLNIIRRPETESVMNDIEILDFTYLAGKIYVLVNEETDEPFYVGSTTMSLEEREYYHRLCCKSDPDSRGYFRYLIPFANSLKGWYIDLYENYPCRSKKELNIREGQVIKELKEMFPELCNHQIPGRTRDEYYEDNQETILQKAKEYYEANKDTINRPVICECGATTTANAIRGHQRTSDCKKKRGIPDNMYKCKCGECVLDSKKYNHNRTKSHLDAIGQSHRYISNWKPKDFPCACGTVLQSLHHLQRHMKETKSCIEFHMTPEQKAALAEKRRLEKEEYDKGAAQRAIDKTEYKRVWAANKRAQLKAAKEEAKKSEKK